MTRWSSSLPPAHQQTGRRQHTVYSAFQPSAYAFSLTNPLSLSLSLDLSPQVSFSLSPLSPTRRRRTLSTKLYSLMPSVSSCPCQIPDGQLINNKQGEKNVEKNFFFLNGEWRRWKEGCIENPFFIIINLFHGRLDAVVLDEWSCGIRSTVSSLENVDIRTMNMWENVSQRGKRNQQDWNSNEKLYLSIRYLFKH